MLNVFGCTCMLLNMMQVVNMLYTAYYGIIVIIIVVMHHQLIIQNNNDHATHV